MIKVNFHTHTNYCDGHASVNEIVMAAIEQGLRQIGFSSHAPLPVEAGWSLTDETEMTNYVSDIISAKEQYQGKIQIFAGIEADYIPGMSVKFSELKQKFHLDYVIGAVHLVKPPLSDELWFIDGKQSFFDRGIEKCFNGDAKKAALTYFRQIREMIANEEFDIIAHFDKIKMNNAGRFFSEDEDWYQAEIIEILHLLKQSNIIMEINTRGFYQKKVKDMYPADWIIRHAASLNIPVMINSDAHKPAELLAGFDEAGAILRNHSYRHVMIKEGRQWTPHEF
jgi:histidinol-phosphatase (PHP family)